jgi:hypothetical protein
MVNSISSSPESVTDFLFLNINIQVSGGCGPYRTEPNQCYHPFHRPYRSGAVRRKSVPIDACMAAVMPGGAVPRAVVSDAVDSGQAVVYDRDIVSTWRIPSPRIAQQVFFWEKAFEHALAQETMFVAIEAFVDDLRWETGMSRGLPVIATSELTFSVRRIRADCPITPSVSQIPGRPGQAVAHHHRLQHCPRHD